MCAYVRGGEEENEEKMGDRAAQQLCEESLAARKRGTRRVERGGGISHSGYWREMVFVCASPLGKREGWRLDG